MEDSKAQTIRYSVLRYVGSDEYVWQVELPNSAVRYSEDAPTEAAAVERAELYISSRGLTPVRDDDLYPLPTNSEKG